MSIKKKGLGKGLDSLIPDNKSIKSVTPDKSAEAKKEAEEKAGVQTMKINEVEPNRDQPRKNFDEDFGFHQTVRCITAAACSEKKGLLRNHCR